MDYSDIKQDLFSAVEGYFALHEKRMTDVINKLCDSLSVGGKILVFGNGGSASQAQHFAAELVNKFLKPRPPLRALALTTDTSALTSIANDVDYDHVFSRQIEALGDRGDVALALSTSGNSPSVLLAMEKARSLGLITVALTGKGGGKAGALADYLLDVPAGSTPRIQEVHLLLLHIIALQLESLVCS